MIPLSAGIFFTSGVAALLYQVIWQRLLALFSGADLYSVTIIVAAFMGGMGVGHLVGGHLADRLSARAALVGFAVSELSIALFGYFSDTLYYDVLYQRFGHLDIPALAMGGLLFVSLLWPTFFMGASLPLLARALTDRIDRAASVIGVLYGVNTLGAAAGALVSTWWLLPRLGLDGTLRVGAALNVACAVALVAASALTRQARTAAAAAPSVAPAASASDGIDADGPSLPFSVWAVIYAASGLVALALEVVWFRLLTVMMKGTAFTFGTLLGVYLIGLGVGALVGSAVAPRIRRPAIAFLTMQACIGLTALGLLAVFMRRVDDIPMIATYLASYEPLNVRASVHALLGGVATPDATPSTFLLMYIGVPVLLVLPPTLLMGAAFPVLQREVQQHLHLVGRRVGMLLVANVVGSLVGTVATGLWLLDRFGTGGTLKVLAVVSAGFGVLACYLALRDARRDAPATSGSRASLGLVAAPAVGLALVLAILPATNTIWAHLHGTIVEGIEYAEDGSGVAVAKTDNRRAVTFASGIGQGALPYGDVHTALGALPSFLHPAPKRVAVIGLGSGDTVHAVAGRQDIEHIDSIEIVRGEIQTLRDLRQRLPYGGLANLLDDRRIQQVFADGRLFLRRGALYDIIEADALRPSSAYSGNLYSDAYFELMRAHLAPGGFAATWAPTQRVTNTFLRVFPYVVALPGMLIGSNDPITVDREAVLARVREAGAREHFARADVNIEALATEYLQKPVLYGPEFSRDSLGEINTDLFPRDEFELAP